jgi:hypothetical protein
MALMAGRGHRHKLPGKGIFYHGASADMDADFAKISFNINNLEFLFKLARGLLRKA